MAGEALGVGHDDLAGGIPEDAAQGVHLGGGAAPAGGRVGLVGDEHHLGGHLPASHAAARLRLGHEALHHRGDVLDVQSCAMKGAVGETRGEHLAQRGDPALAGGRRALHHEGGRAHAHDHPVATAVEGQGRVFDVLVGGGGARGEETRTEPLHEGVGAGLVAGDHDHPAAAARADPVLGHAHRLGRARAGGVDLGIGSPRPDVLGELRVAHGQDTEKEAPVEEEAIVAQASFPLLHPAVQLLDRRRGRARHL